MHKFIEKVFFENPTRFVFVDERWTDPKTGKSTGFAEKFAEGTEVDLDKLASDVAVKIPDRTKLNMAEQPVVAGDTLLAVLKKGLPRGTFADGEMMKLSYEYMRKNAKADNMDINYLEVGDQVSVSNGEVWILRGETAKEKGFKDVLVNIYPWEADADEPERGGPSL